MARLTSSYIRVAAAAFLFSLILVAVFVILGWQSQKDRLNADGCLERGDKALHVILIDVSEKLRPQQKNFLASELLHIMDNGARGEVFALYELTQNSGEPIASLGRACSPGPYKVLIEGRRAWEIRKEKNFIIPIQKAIEQGIEGDELPKSPIIEAFVAIDAKEFRNQQWMSKRLTIASDLLQHSEALSHYKGLPLFEDFWKTPVYMARRPDLTGVKVRFLYLHREAYHNLQSRKHVMWWEKWVQSNGGSTSSVKRISGDIQQD